MNQKLQNNARYYRHLLCYDAFWGLKTIFGHLWHLLGSKSHLIIDQKNQKNVRFYWRVWGSISKSHLIFGQQKSENARYYRYVLRIKNNFRGGGEGTRHQNHSLLSTTKNPKMLDIIGEFLGYKRTFGGFLAPFGIKTSWFSPTNQTNALYYRRVRVGGRESWKNPWSYRSFY